MLIFSTTFLTCLWLNLFHGLSASRFSERERSVFGQGAFFRSNKDQIGGYYKESNRRSDTKTENDEELDQIRQGRLFSNPFGILGHDSCTGDIEGTSMSGICYNEVECVVRGGTMGGYCGPPAVKGVCCVFSSSECDSKVREKTFYFKNKSYPRNDLEPFQCQLKIKTMPETCWIRFDYIDFDLTSDGSGGACVYDSFGILDSPDGPGGRFCGFKSGYSVVTRAPQHKDLRLSVVVQGPSYRWNVKISQIRCDKVWGLPSHEACGRSNPETRQFQKFINDISDSSKFFRERKSTAATLTSLPTNPTPADATPEENNLNLKTKKLLKKRIIQSNDTKDSLSVPSISDNVCGDSSESCSVMGLLNATSAGDAHEGFKTLRRRQRLRRSSGANLADSETIISKKKLRAESYHPSFTVKNSYCTPKIRDQQQCSRNGAQRTNQNSFQKLLDGTETGINEYPWVVSLNLNDQQFCGGTLISNDWVLTAAHCMDFGNVHDFLPRVLVSLSDHDVSKRNETQSFYRRVSQVINYPTWHNLATVKGDFAIIKLDSPVEFSRTVSPICLPENPSETFAGKQAIAVGWGITDSGKPSNYLRQVELDIIENVTCYEQFSMFDIQIQEDMLCTFSGPKGTETTCSGDSGSPLMVNENGHFILAGLVSFGMSECSAMFPSVYTRTTFFLEWIKAAITPVP